MNELEQDKVTQEDSIDENVEEHIQAMGWLWHTVQERLNSDAICFDCKKKVDFTGNTVRVLEATATEKGVCAFVGICEDCFNAKKEVKEMQEKGEKE